MSKSLIFTATYNEVFNIEKVITNIKKNSPQSDILVIDDNSPDGTFKLLKRIKKKNKCLKILLREKKLGLDTAHKYAYNYAIKNNYQFLITMDADLSHDPKEIKKMLKILKRKPFVIGSRYINGGKCEMSFPRLILSYIGNKFIKNLLDLKCNEFTTSYRGFNLKELKNFNLNNVRSKGYSFFMESIYLLSKKKFSIIEIPIKFRNRMHGESKIPKIEIFRTLKNVFLLYLKDKI